MMNNSGLDQETAIKYYSRRDIQKSIVEAAKNREIAVRFQDSFGKRPDILKYPAEILDLAKKGATSFHSSEELWDKPSLISTGMKKNELDKLKIGWDLILDIDAPEWQISKLTAWLLINSLKDYGLKSISVKFSGNKGFHIAVPFESFPQQYEGTDTKLLFPQAARNIATLLLEHISEKYIEIVGSNKIIFGKGLEKRFSISTEKLQKATGKSLKEISKLVCQNCGKDIESAEIPTNVDYVCPRCEKTVTENRTLQFVKCDRCNILMQSIKSSKSLCSCGSNSSYRKFNPFTIIEVDTILISTRHLFRMPYSLHEKSGLASLPFNPEKILLFEKKYTQPEKLKVSKHIFCSRQEVFQNEAMQLLDKAMKKASEKEAKDKSDIKKEYVPITEAIPESFFPPCINLLLNGLEDGKKRALFILVKFLKSVGWSNDMIDKRIREWNKKNPDPLKISLIEGQLAYYKRVQEKMLAPNCENKMYYEDMRVCKPDPFCKKIKNPVNYATMRFRIDSKKMRPKSKKRVSPKAL